VKYILAVLFLVLNFIFADTVDLSVTVVGNVFTLELQDANAFPLTGELDLGKVTPGTADFPVHGVVVAGCKSNTGIRWSLQAEMIDPLIDHNSGHQLPKGAVKVRGLSSSKSPEGAKLPGNLVKVEQPLADHPIVVYASDNEGDLGFNNYEGTYVALGFGVDVPQAQPAGTYSGRVLLTLTE
jgi:hypothetical protein